MATNLHKNSDENNKHTPKGFSAASNMSRLLRDEEGESTYTPEQMLPAAIDFVDGNAAPPTEVSGDIYVLVDLGSGAENAGWDGASYNDWVRFNGTVWVDITPSNGDICYDKSEDIYKRYESPNWLQLVPDAENIYNTNSTFTGNRTADLNSNTLTFSNGGGVIIEGDDTLSTSTVFKLQDGDTVPSDLWDFRANADVYQGANSVWYLQGNNLQYELSATTNRFGAIASNSYSQIYVDENTNNDLRLIGLTNNTTTQNGFIIDTQANSRQGRLRLFSSGSLATVINSSSTSPSYFSYDLVVGHTGVVNSRMFSVDNRTGSDNGAAFGYNGTTHLNILTRSTGSYITMGTNAASGSSADVLISGFTLPSHFDNGQGVIIGAKTKSGSELVRIVGDTLINGNINATTYSVNGTAGANFSGAVTNITVVDGIVTAVS